MNSFSYVLPWTTPGPIGLILGTGLVPLAFVLAVVLILVDVLVYYPFFKVYDNQILENEAKIDAELETKKEVEVYSSETVLQNETEVKSEEAVTTVDLEISKNKDFSKKVLVLCAGGGTSGLLSNALNKAAEEYNVDISSMAGAYGTHQDILKDYDLVILAPQVASNYEDIKKDTDRLGVKLAKTEGMEYINLTRDPKGSLEYVMKQFEE